MAFDAETLNEIVSGYVADVRNAMPIDRAFLYGSYAKGTATERSDIDICFFSHDFEDLSFMEVLTRLFRLTRRFKGIDIEPRGYPTSELKNDNPFIKEVLRTGREV